MKVRSSALISSGSFLWIAVALSFSNALSQESLIGIGNVNSDGTLGASSSPSGATISSSRLAEGSYEVSINQSGAFAGLDVEDFIVEAGIESGISLDIGITARIASVSNDNLVVGIRTLDLEDSSSVNNPVSSDRSFYFLIRHAPAGGVTSIQGESRHLLAVGKIDGFSGVDFAFGVGGVSVEFSRESAGHNQIFLEKPGAFIGDNSEDYLIFLTALEFGGDTEDELQRGDVKSTVLDSSVTFTVRTDDVQANPAGDEGTPIDGIFAFAIYRLGGSEVTGPPSSRLVLMTTSVRGSDGQRMSSATSIPGGNVITNRNSEGVYFVSLTEPGAFAGVNTDRYVPIVTVKGGTTDQIATANVGIVNDDTLQVTVRTKDVQTGGQSEGVLEDNDFYLVLYDTEADYAQDLGIGVRNVPASFRTLGVRNASGADQAIVVKPRATRRQRFFLGSENAGRSLDGLRLRQTGTGKGVATDYFRLTGGRVNVTATVKIGGFAAAAVRPEEFIQFEGGIRYLKSDRRRSKSFRLQATSENAPASIDVNTIRSIPR